jgi:hypothetical protein
MRMSVENAALDQRHLLYEVQSKATGFSNEAALDRVEANPAIQQG